jgi:hypothetical protein
MANSRRCFSLNFWLASPAGRTAAVNEHPLPRSGYTDLSAATEAPSATDLRDLANQLSLIADELRQVVDIDPCPEAGVTHAIGGSSRDLAETPGNLAIARQAYALRRRRDDIFGRPGLFGEPAWDILLDLYIAHCEGKPVSVSSACIGSAAPPTTGLRWLGVLAHEGLIVRENDSADNRRVMVRLSDAGIAAMENFLNAARTSTL